MTGEEGGNAQAFEGHWWEPSADHTGKRAAVPVASKTVSAESYRMTVPLRAVTNLAPKGEADVEYASLMASGDITVTLPKSALPDGASVKETLMSNAVSILYGYLRASLASMTARTSLGDYVLPAINPVAYVCAIMRQAEVEPEPAGA